MLTIDQALVSSERDVEFGFPAFDGTVGVSGITGCLILESLDKGSYYLGYYIRVPCLKPPCSYGEILGSRGPGLLILLLAITDFTISCYYGYYCIGSL